MSLYALFFAAFPGKRWCEERCFSVDTEQFFLNPQATDGPHVFAWVCKDRIHAVALIHSSWLLFLALLHASRLTLSPFSSFFNPGWPKPASTTHLIPQTVFKGLHGFISNQDTHAGHTHPLTWMHSGFWICSHFATCYLQRAAEFHSGWVLFMVKQWSFILLLLR